MVLKESPKESPKKVPKTTSTAMQVDDGKVDDGKEASRATSAAILVGDGGGSKASNLNVYAYARPDPHLKPSQMGVEVESEWYNTSETRVLGDSECQALARTFWGQVHRRQR